MSEVIATQAILKATVKEAHGIYKSLDLTPEDFDSEDPAQRRDAEGLWAAAWRNTTPVDGYVLMTLDENGMDFAADRLEKSHPALSKQIKEYRSGNLPEPESEKDTSWLKL